MEDLAQGHFSILGFYERRIRRIFPALCVLLLASLGATSFLFLPRDFKDLSQSLSATAVFVSNMFFWHETDYFSPAAETKPLLHTWSLAVEEQYYILFPPFLWLLVRGLRQHTGIVMALTLLPLFALNVWLTGKDPTLAFYGLPTRAWELLAGAVVAILAKDWRPSALNAHILGGLGFALVTLGFVVINRSQAFPGLWVALPVLGTTFILLAGQATQGGFVTRLLSSPFAVWIGLISYSLYLWHWPILVFAEYYAQDSLSPLQTTGALALSFILAALSWRYIEQPFRNRAFLRRSQIFALGLGAMATLLVLGLIGHFTNGLPQRLPPDVVRLSSKAYELENLALPDRAQCLGSLKNPDFALRRAKQRIFCPLNALRGAPQVLLWGDSHAEALRPAFENLPVVGVFAGFESCPPLSSVWIAAAPDQACRRYNQAVMDFIEKTPSIRHVILFARWAYYGSGQPLTRGGDRPVVLRQVQREGSNPEILRMSLKRTLASLQNRGLRITIILGTPEIRQDVSDAKAKNILYERNIDLNAVLAPTLQSHRARNAAVAQILRQVAQEYGVNILDPADSLCSNAGDSGTCPVLDVDGSPVYRDDDHLSIRGAQLLRSLLQVKIAF